MASNKKEEPPRNVPLIKVRQQWTSKCGETCGGQGHAREPRTHPCGSSPPPTTQEDLTCGLRDCYPGDTCRCRCHCMLRQLMRQKLETDINPNTRITRESLVEDVPLLHMARVHTLEPRCPSVPQALPSSNNSSTSIGLKPLLMSHPITMPSGATEPILKPSPSCQRALFEQILLLQTAGQARSFLQGDDQEEDDPYISKVSRWWLTYGALPPEPCRGRHCFFASPHRTTIRPLNRTKEVLGELPEWKLGKLKHICNRKCVGRALALENQAPDDDAIKTPTKQKRYKLRDTKRHQVH